MHKPLKHRMLIVSLALFVALCVGAVGSAAPRSLAQGPSNRASLIVVFGPGDVFSSCVSFAEPEIDGVQLLQRAGLTVVSQAVAGLGVSVCKIEEAGCDYPGQACFCECLGAPCSYWSYWSWSEGAWEYSGRGASQDMVLPGEIVAWVWGDGQLEPPPIAVQGVCGAADVTLPSATPNPPAGINQDPYPEGTLQPTDLPAATEEAVATPEPEATIDASYPGQPTDDTTAATPTTEPVGELPSATATVQQSATDQPSSNGNVSPSPLPQNATMTPDRSATVVARAATNAALTGVPDVNQQAAERRSYWAFMGIALLLAVVIGYVLLLRRQRARQNKTST